VRPDVVFGSCRLTFPILILSSQHHSKGFSEFALGPDFQSYVDYVIQPSYELHQRMGLLRYTMAGERMEEEMTFRRFLSGRILWDEGMASGAFSWCSKNPGGLLIGLVGADHVKFKNGIPGRFSRMAAKENLLDCKSVVINPTLIDSRPSGSVASIPTSDLAQYPERITLQLRYVKSASVNPETGVALERKEGVLPFSDYVVLT
jgi:Haem-binding uptake, Tiki superfamily, ChaN